MENEVGLVLAKVRDTVVVMAHGNILDTDAEYESARDMFNGTGIELKNVRVTRDIADECLAGNRVKLIEVYNA